MNEWTAAAAQNNTAHKSILYCQLAGRQTDSLYNRAQHPHNNKLLSMPTLVVARSIIRSSALVLISSFHWLQFIDRHQGLELLVQPDNLSQCWLLVNHVVRGHAWLKPLLEVLQTCAQSETSCSQSGGDHTIDTFWCYCCIDYCCKTTTPTEPLSIHFTALSCCADYPRCEKNWLGLGLVLCSSLSCAFFWISYMLANQSLELHATVWWSSSLRRFGLILSRLPKMNTSNSIHYPEDLMLIMWSILGENLCENNQVKRQQLHYKSCLAS